MERKATYREIARVTGNDILKLDPDQDRNQPQRVDREAEAEVKDQRMERKGHTERGLSQANQEVQSLIRGHIRKKRRV